MKRDKKMARRMFVELTVKLEIIVDQDDITAEEVINEMDYNFTSQTDNAKIIDMEIVDSSECSSN